MGTGEGDLLDCSEREDDLARSEASAVGMPSSGDGGAASSGEALRSGERELAREEEGAAESVATVRVVGTARPPPRALPLPLARPRAPRPLPRPRPRAVEGAAEAAVSESDVEGEVRSDMEPEGAGEIGTMPSVVVDRADREVGERESSMRVFGRDRVGCSRGRFQLAG